LIVEYRRFAQLFLKMRIAFVKTRRDKFIEYTLCIFPTFKISGEIFG